MTHRPHDPHCIFCKIVHGEIPSARVLETAEAVAFLDINPVNHGHTLLVPKAHHAHLSELPDAVAARDRLALAPALPGHPRGHRRRRAQRDRQQRPGRRPDHRSLPLAHHPTLPRRRGQLALAAQRLRRRRAEPDEIPHRARVEPRLAPGPTED